MRTCNCLHRARLSPEASARASAKAVTALLMPLLEAITTLLTATLGQQPCRKLSGGCSGKAVRIGTTHAAHIHRGSSSAPLEQRELRKTGRREVSGAPRRTSSWRPSRLRTLHGLPNIRDALLHEDQTDQSRVLKKMKRQWSRNFSCSVLVGRLTRDTSAFAACERLGVAERIALLEDTLRMARMEWPPPPSPPPPPPKPPPSPPPPPKKKKMVRREEELTRLKQQRAEREMGRKQAAKKPTSCMPWTSLSPAKCSTRPGKLRRHAAKKVRKKKRQAHSARMERSESDPKAIELKWPADRNDSSTGCVVGIATADNLAAGTYGGYSSEIIINWAAAHGYSYSLFVHGYSLNKTEDKARLLWAKPQAMRNMLQRPMCAWVMCLDGDAVINQPRFSVEEKLLRFVAPAVPAVRILLTCHSPFGGSDDCLPCKCCRAGDCPASARAKPAPADGSVANTGVVLVRNDPDAREMIRWWANAGDGECDARSYFGEQNCAGRMQRRWVNQIDVVSAAVMNAPIWYDPTHWNVNTIQEYKLARQAVRSNHSRPVCLSSDLFICHAYAMRAALRVVSFRAHHATVVEPLRHLLARRGRTYAERPAWIAWKRHTLRGG
jgi:hypothetical protein